MKPLWKKILKAYISLTKAETPDEKKFYLDFIVNKYQEALASCPDEFKKDLIRCFDKVSKKYNIETKSKPVTLPSNAFTVQETSEIDGEEISEIFTLIKHGDLKALETWVEAKSPINWKIYDKDGRTPLHLAITQGDLSICHLLLKNGCSINIPNLKGLTPLEQACINHDPNLVNFMISMGASVKKYVALRDKSKGVLLFDDDIDFVLCLKEILKYEPIDWYAWILKENQKFKIIDSDKINDILNWPLWEKKVGWGEWKWNEIINHYAGFIKNYPGLIPIVLDELNYETKDLISCPSNILKGLVLFTWFCHNFQFNCSSSWVINHELITLASHYYNKYNDEWKDKFLEKIENDYVKTGLYSEDYLGILVSPWLNKL